jgi:hypothetical protein
MKLRSLLGIAAVTALFTSSCNSHYKSDDLAIPVLQAIQDNDFDDLKCMVPNDDIINEVFNGNTAALGGNFYNKYTSEYRKLSLETALHNDLEMIQDISKQNNLDWDNAGWGAVKSENITDSAASYTRVTIPLQFKDGGEYTLSYKTVQYNGIWYLLDDLYLERVRKE